MLTFLLLGGLFLPWVTAGFEWQQLRSNLAYFDNPKPWGPWDVVPLWVLLFKTYLVFLPGMIASGALAVCGWARTAAGLFLAVTACVFAWIGIDLEMFTRTGAHVSYYLQFAFSPEATKWAGDAGATVRDAVFALLPVTAVGAGVSIVCGLAAALIWRAGRTGLAPTIVALLAAAHVLLLVSIGPVQMLTPEGRREDLQRLHDLLPYNLTWTAPGVRLVDVDAFQGPLNARLEPVLRDTLPAILDGPPADTSPAAAPITTGPKPKLVVIVIDSLRADSMTSDVMPRLTALSKRGLVLRRHYAGARITHLGLFNLLYGRPAAAYRPTLRANVPPQMCVSLRRAGYQASYVSGVPHFAWMRMHAFLNEHVFDRMRIVALQDWPTSDRRALATARRILGGDEPPAANGAPQFVTVFLASTHFPYVYPPEFDIRRPTLGADWGVLSLEPERDRPALLNRYHNACEFLDHAVGDFVENLDLSNTVVIITGDHGESFWDDGFLIHGTRWSDVQSVVPCVLLGPGVEPSERTDLTTHQDLLPTLLRIAGGQPVAPANTTGRDLLAGTAPPEMAVLAGDSDLERFQLLVSLRDRRLLLEFPHHRPSVLVKGTVDSKGRIDPYDLPPPRDADEWAVHLARLLTDMTEQRPSR